MNGMSREDAQEFIRRKQEETADARQTAAFFLSTGIDLAAALASPPAARAEIARRVERLLERERLKGLRKHWSYDLNRHIALKQACDRLAGATGEIGNVANDKAERQEPQKRKRRPKAPHRRCSGLPEGDRSA